MTFTEADIPSLFDEANRHYQEVMRAAGTGQITPDAEREIYEALKWLDKLCEADVTHGEPRGLRGDMYMILAQTERERTYLDKAEADLSEAIRIGSANTSNAGIWRRNLDNVRRLRSLI